MTAAADVAGDPYVRAGSVEEATRLLGEHGPDAKLVAGGQSLTLMLRQGFLEPGVVIDIGAIPELRGVEADGDDGLRVGAATTYSELAAAYATRGFRGVRDAVAVIADRQVRNLGTIGGALSHADPSLDIVPPLRCLDATVHVSGPDGDRDVPLGEFHVDHMTTALEHGELVRSVSIPPRPQPWGAAYEKHAGVHGGWATVGAAAGVELTDDASRFDSVRVAFAAVADTAVRAPTVEAALEGEPVNADAVAAATEHVAADIDPIGDQAGSAAYKERVAAGLAARSLRRAAERAGGSP